MEKRLKLQCWSCPQVYFYLLQNAGQQEIIVSCPYCKAEAVVDLRLHPEITQDVFRGDEITDGLPDDDDDILPTTKRK